MFSSMKTDVPRMVLNSPLYVQSIPPTFIISSDVLQYNHSIYSSVFIAPRETQVMPSTLIEVHFYNIYVLQFCICRKNVIEILLFPM